MVKDVDIVVLPEQGNDLQYIQDAAAQKAGWNASDVRSSAVLKRSIDARGKKVKLLVERVSP